MVKIQQYFYSWFLLASLVASTSPASWSQDSSPSETEIIGYVGHDVLRKGMKLLHEGKRLEKGTRPVKLMQFALQERPLNVSLSVIACLLNLLKKNGYSLEKKEKHQVMSYAIENNAPFEVIQYLVEHQIFDPKQMKGDVRYDMTLQIPVIRIIMIEILGRSLLPKKVNGAMGVFSVSWFLMRLICWIFRLTTFFDKHAEIGNISALIWPVERVINTMLMFFYLVYKIGIAPNYLMLALLSKRAKKEKEKLAFLFLEHGADPNAKCFIIKSLTMKSQHPDIKMMQNFYEPACYMYMSTIQLAAKYNLLPLVKELLRLEVDTDTRAVYLEDKLDSTKPMSSEQLVSVWSLYRRKGKNATYKQLLDFPGPKTKTYRYLAKKGFKHEEQA